MEFLRSPHRGRPRILLSVVVCAALLSACSGPQALVELTADTDARSSHEPFTALGVKLRSDRRPPHEHGTRAYLGKSYLGGNSLEEPTSVSLLRILARDLVAAGIARKAEVGLEAPPYTLLVGINHLYAGFSEGIENLTLILPTSRIIAACDIQLVLQDEKGRTFLDRTYLGEASSNAAILSGLESSAARTLAVAIRQAIDQALPEIRQAEVDFWRRYADRGSPRDP